MKEEFLLTNTLEYTNEPYAIAKIAGIKMCESYNLQYGTNYISVMPTNLYGPNDNFDLEKSHVLPALIRKIHLAKLKSENNWNALMSDINVSNKEEAEKYLSKFGIVANGVEIWGTGKPRREFLWSKDMADACVFLMENRNFNDTFSKDDIEVRNTHINIGTGEDISIKQLAELIKEIIGFKGELFFNANKPDGTLRKLTDVSKLNALGWKHRMNLENGIKEMYDWYRAN
jgi:GDP-L-fucose synthase